MALTAPYAPTSLIARITSKWVLFAINVLNRIVTFILGKTRNTPDEIRVGDGFLETRFHAIVPIIGRGKSRIG